MLKLAIITTHPIQYYAPIFRLLHERAHIAIRVYYTAGEQAERYDAGFDQTLSWDIPLLEGYPYQWVRNTSARPGSHHPGGIVNPDLIDCLTGEKPDALLIFGWNYHSHLRLMRHFKGLLPVYFRGDSTLLTETGAIRNILRTLYLRWVYHHIDHAFYVGTNNRAYFKKCGLKDRQLSFAPHAVDNNRFGTARIAEAAAFRDSLGIPEKAIMILYAGKLEPVKNVSLLIGAFARLEHPGVYLVLAGNGPEEKALKKHAKKTTVNNRIRFHDFVNQSGMPVVYQAADLFCLPSFSETWGLSVNEAMSCQKAVLVSDQVGCAIDLVKNKHNGAIFKSNDQSDLLCQLRKLTYSREMLLRYGQNSGLIIQNWNFTAIVNAVETQMLSQKLPAKPNQFRNHE
jgi:glycosyltransferase involved in cell wall biosynthesis